MTECRGENKKSATKHQCRVQGNTANARCKETETTNPQSAHACRPTTAQHSTTIPTRRAMTCPAVWPATWPGWQRALPQQRQQTTAQCLPAPGGPAAVGEKHTVQHSSTSHSSSRHAQSLRTAPGTRHVQQASTPQKPGAVVPGAASHRAFCLADCCAVDCCCVDCVLVLTMARRARASGTVGALTMAGQPAASNSSSRRGQQAHPCACQQPLCRSSRACRTGVLLAVLACSRAAALAARQCVLAAACCLRLW